MAMQGPFPVEFGKVFPSGVYAAGGFEKVRDFDRSSGDRVVQQADKQETDTRARSSSGHDPQRGSQHQTWLRPRNGPK